LILSESDLSFTFAYSRGLKGRGRGWGAGGRNDPNNVCIYEYLNKEKNQEKRSYFMFPFSDMMESNIKNKYKVDK
jgi:hypothetical protein